MGEITRRRFLRGSGLLFTGLVIKGCSNIKNQTIETPTPDSTSETLRLLERTKQEVMRLAKTYPENSIVRTVYLGDLSKICPIFIQPLKIGIADPKTAYTRTYFGEANHSPNRRFRYYLERDQSKADYSTLTSQDLTIFFSPLWLNAALDQVKILALEKEALTVASWEPFSAIALQIYQSQGKIEKIDSSVKDIEIGRTLTRQLFIENPLVRKLYDYSGYLLILRKVEDLFQTGNEQAKKDLSYTNIPAIYAKAKAAGVEFESLTFNSPEFWRVAFDQRSPWVKIISDPSIPGPQ